MQTLNVLRNNVLQLLYNAGTKRFDQTICKLMYVINKRHAIVHYPKEKKV